MGVQQPQARTPRGPPESCSAQLSAPAQLERHGHSLALLLFVLDLPTCCCPLPQNNILPVRFGETPRSPPDTSTNQSPAEFPPLGSLLVCFGVPHILLPALTLSVVRHPREASASLQFTGVTCKKGLIVHSLLQTQLLSSLHQTKVLAGNEWPT